MIKWLRSKLFWAWFCWICYIAIIYWVGHQNWHRRYLELFFSVFLGVNFVLALSLKFFVDKKQIEV
jgi:hypothetical protein